MRRLGQPRLFFLLIEQQLQNPTWQPPFFILHCSQPHPTTGDPPTIKKLHHRRCLSSPGSLLPSESHHPNSGHPSFRFTVEFYRSHLHLACFRRPRDRTSALPPRDCCCRGGATITAVVTRCSNFSPRFSAFVCPRAMKKSWSRQPLGIGWVSLTSLMFYCRFLLKKDSSLYSGSHGGCRRRQPPPACHQPPPLTFLLHVNIR